MSSFLELTGKGISRTIKSNVIQSPLAGVTDKIFRKFVRRWAPNSLLFTEMVNATSLNLGYGIEKIDQIIYEDGPVGVQIFDNRPFAVAEAAKESEDAGAYLIDINMGCPVKKIAKKGCGSALIKDPELAVELVKRISKAVQIPVTVKTRIGWKNYDEQIKDFVLRLQDAGANMLTIHGRTREQGFTGKADWQIIGELKEILEIPVIANGDIRNGNDAKKCLNITKADGIMIGRGLLGSPWLIGEIDASIKGDKTFKSPSIEDRLKLMIEHLDALVEEKGDHGLLIARKHISWICKDFPNANILRSKLVRVKTPEESKELIQKEISEFKNLEK
tara:strand:- start:2280 stop:3278 length:999 start_codon:yes stop_codon:yes gene_type:complete